MKRYGFLLCLATITTWNLGCQPSTPTPTSDSQAAAPADAHAGHDHGEMGQHGGHLLHLEPSGAHAEWTHDDEAQSIQVHLDDFDANKISEVKFVVKIGDDSQDFPLTKSEAGWTITSEELMTHINMGEAALVRLVVVDDSGEQSTKIEAHDHHHH